MTRHERDRRPGEAEPGRTTPWQYLLHSLYCGLIAASLLAVNIFFPEGIGVRSPALVALAARLVGELGVAGLFGLASVALFAAGVSGFLRGE